MALLCFDLDGTLCTNTGGAYEEAQPFAWAIARVNRLAAAGHEILIYTARGTATGIDWEPVTRGQLQRWGVRYDELRFGKPSAAVFIDDRAVHTEAWRRSGGAGPPALAAPGPGGGEVLPSVLPADATTVVETARTFDGRPIRLEQHVERLLGAAARAGIRHPPAPEAVTGAVTEALAGCDGEALYVISVADVLPFAGLEARASGEAPRLGVAVRPLTELHGALEAMLTQPGDRGAPPVVRGSLQAGPGPAREAWPLDRGADGTVSAGLGGRLGIVRDGAVALESISGAEDVESAWLTELAGDLGLAIATRALSEGDLAGAEEAFVVGVPFCLLGLELGSSRPARPVAARLWRAWGTSVGAALTVPAPAEPAAVGGSGERA